MGGWCGMGGRRYMFFEPIDWVGRGGIEIRGGDAFLLR